MDTYVTCGPMGLKVNFVRTDHHNTHLISEPFLAAKLNPRWSTLCHDSVVENIWRTSGEHRAIDPKVDLSVTPPILHLQHLLDAACEPDVTRRRSSEDERPRTAEELVADKQTCDIHFRKRKYRQKKQRCLRLSDCDGVFRLCGANTYSPGKWGRNKDQNLIPRNLHV